MHAWIAKTKIWLASAEGIVESWETKVIVSLLRAPWGNRHHHHHHHIFLIITATHSFDKKEN